MRQTFAATVAEAARAFALPTARRAGTAPITYTGTATASGSVGAAVFVDARVTLGFIGDTGANSYGSSAGQDRQTFALGTDMTALATRDLGGPVVELAVFRPSLARRR